jgi:hypothetical protein
VIPAGGYIQNPNWVASEQPSRTWKLDFQRGRVSGMTDGPDAIRQAVYKTLRTERFRYLIYSSDYGVKLESLVGRNPVYVHSELRRRLQEALLQDSRILAIEDFAFEENGDAWTAKFTAVTNSGNIEIVQEVKAGV